MSNSDGLKLGTFVGLAIMGIFFGIGPFAKGHKLLEATEKTDQSNYEFYDCNYLDNSISFKGHKSCNISSHNCHYGIDQDNDGLCDECLSHGYRCHMVYHH